MVVQTRLQMTRAAFGQWIEQGENQERTFEYLDGEIVEVPSNPFVSVIAARIITFISLYLMQAKLPGYVTGEGGGYLVNGQVFAPDVAYVRQLPTNKGYELTPPLLAVEVLSDPHNNVEQSDLRRKLAHYRQAGVVVWVVDYVAQQVERHQPDGGVEVLNSTGSLDGGEVLPGFTLAVDQIFPKEA